MKRGMWRHRRPKAMHRWLRFNFVGLIGVVVQLCVLQISISAKLDYRVATLVAVEMAVLNNFFWHLRFTWRERRLQSSRLVLRRLMEFHLTNGLVSLAGSWTLMALLVGRARMPVIVANIVSIVACSMVNFLLAEVLVFRTPHGSRVT
jgi:putative flippase GtrA